MIFSTTFFVFLFLPIALGVYHLVPWRFKSLTIMSFSYVFYGWWRVEYLLLIFLVSLVSYFAAQATVISQDQRIRKTALIAGVSFDLAALGFFKYANFFVENFNGILTFAGGATLTLPEILLPIGISFHTFQSISYVVDVYRRDAPPARRIADFLAFGAMFPQLIAGPVLRYKDLADQFLRRDMTLPLFTKGFYRFVTGLSMKVLVADMIAPLADRIFAHPQPSFLESWLGVLAYTFQLFFDFAGYSAMAIGMGLMMGFRFIENFDAPYLSRSITEFWRRWHISLSTWLRDYLYVPLGGNRLGTRRTYLNLILTMVLGGVWHGANWTFIVWGLWHGGLMAVERAMGAKKRGTVWPQTIAWPFTFMLVVLGWVVFRAPDLSTAAEFYAGMAGAYGFGIGLDIGWQIQPSELIMLAIAAIICLIPRVRLGGGQQMPAGLQTLVYSSLFLLSASRLAAESYSPFLYFQF